MHNRHSRNTVRYYILIVAFLLCLFFSNDFGLLDVQKTAIVMAAGIDREADEFIVTSQIAIPQASTQGKSTQSVQLVSRGKTIAQAFEEINAKTGWYAKLVFCDLILIGENAAKENVFDALDYFLLDEYMSDSCLVATCNGFAKELLDAAALVDPSSSAAMKKVLSTHAARVGTVLPNTLREFSIGYFGDSKSSFLPVLKTQPQQEQVGENPPSGENAKSGEGQSGLQNGSQTDNAKNKPVFSAEETALFVNGKWVATLTPTQTFALNVAKNPLKLAAYSVGKDEQTCTLSIKNNDQKTKLVVTQGGSVLKVNVTLTAGLLDYSSALPVEKLSDAGDIPDGVFSAAEKKLSGEILEVFEKTKACGCDLFGVRDMLVKYKKRSLHDRADRILEELLPEIKVTFKNVR